jgi:hypothetical protein
MMATATVANHVSREVALRDQAHERVREADPDGDAAKNAGEKAQVQGSARMLSRRAQITSVSVLLVAQLAWFAALGYGAFRVLT